MKKNRKRKIAKTLAASLIVTTVATSAVAVPFASTSSTADDIPKNGKPVEVRLEADNPNLYTFFTYKGLYSGDRYEDIPALMERFNADTTEYKDGVRFVGIADENNRLVSPSDLIGEGKPQSGSDTNIVKLHEVYDLQTYTVTMHEMDQNESFKYTVRNSIDEKKHLITGEGKDVPRKTIPDPKYVPEGAEFVSWRSDTAFLRLEEKDGKRYWPLPYGMHSSFSVTAVYKDKATGEYYSDASSQEEAIGHPVSVTIRKKDTGTVRSVRTYSKYLFKDVPLLKNAIEKGIGTLKQGTIFGGIYDRKTDKRVSANDVIGGDRDLYENLNYINYQISLNELDHKRSLSYEVNSNNEEKLPAKTLKGNEIGDGIYETVSVPDPNYIPDGAVFVGWEAENDNDLIQGIASDGEHYCLLPWDTAKDMNLTAVYQDKDTGRTFTSLDEYNNILAEKAKKAEQNNTSNEDTKPSGSADATSVPEVPKETNKSTKEGKGNDANEAKDVKTAVPKKETVQTHAPSAPAPSTASSAAKKLYNLRSMKIRGVSDKTYTGKNIIQRPYVLIGKKKVYLKVKYGKRKAIGSHYIDVYGDEKKTTGTKRVYYKINPAPIKLSVVTRNGNSAVRATNIIGGAKISVQYRKSGSNVWKTWKNQNLSKGTYYVRARGYKNGCVGKWVYSKALKIRN